MQMDRTRSGSGNGKYRKTVWLDAAPGGVSGRRSAGRGASILISALFSLLSSGLFLAPPAAGNESVAPTAVQGSGNTLATDEGIRFSCDRDRIKRIEVDMKSYLASLGISPRLIEKKTDQTNGTLVFTLNTPKDDFDTLRLKDRPEFAIRDQIIRLPAKNGKTRKVATVSKKEIVLALLQHGRLTEFGGGNCSLRALKEQVGIRQNIVAWAENLNWVWPDGDAAEWNRKYWRAGTPLPGVPLPAAFGDAFENQDRYSFGCYTATKLVMAQGVLDYFYRVAKDPSLLKVVEARLAADHDPLVNVEPGKTWSFEKDFDPAERKRPGKILQVQYGVAPKNFVPGDWVYIVNNDSVSSRKTGYEGSNAIYLGRGRFDDYFNDNGHYYTYRQKLDEVYQWRNGVFSRSRDGAKIQPLSEERVEELGKPPAEGGLVMDFRVFPYVFAGGDVPEIGRSSPPQQ
jgi:hypothetical protein